MTHEYLLVRSPTFVTPSTTARPSHPTNSEKSSQPRISLNRPTASVQRPTRHANICFPISSFIPSKRFSVFVSSLSRESSRLFTHLRCPISAFSHLSWLLLVASQRFESHLLSPMAGPEIADFHQTLAWSIESPAVTYGR